VRPPVWQTQLFEKRNSREKAQKTQKKDTKLFQLILPATQVPLSPFIVLGSAGLPLFAPFVLFRGYSFLLINDSVDGPTRGRSLDLG
jgi:hypothetical protein